MPTIRNTLLGLFTLLLVGLAGAQPLTTSFASKVAHSDAFIGLTTKDGKVLAYLCDGQTLAEWFTGTVAEDGLVDLASGGGLRLQASLTAEGAWGVVTLADGPLLAFTAEPIEAGGTAGFYRAEATADGVDYVGGWIVLASGEERGAVVGGGQLIDHARDTRKVEQILIIDEVRVRLVPVDSREFIDRTGI